MTIYALSTVPGKSGVAIIRVSGKLAKKTIKILTKKNTKPRNATLCKIYDNKNKIIDEAVVIYYENDKSFQNFKEECSKNGTTEESIAQAEKIGFKTNIIAKNPLNKNSKVPVYFANFVLMDYGFGAVFGCPAHDQRDFDFAKKYKLPIIRVVSDKNNPDSGDKMKEAFTGEGKIINSDFLNGLNIDSAKKIIIKKVEKNKIGKKQTLFRLKDWGISRQRYWGCPIPMIYLEDGSVVPVDKSELPIKLPNDVDLKSSGNPLEKNNEGKNPLKCCEDDIEDFFYYR